MERLAQLKQRDPKKPFALLVADLSDLARYAQVSNFAYRVLRQLAPGPFTFMLPATRLVPELLLHRRREVGLRIPDAPVARALVRGARTAAGDHHRHGAGGLLDGGRGRVVHVEGEPLTTPPRCATSTATRWSRCSTPGRCRATRARWSR